MTLFEKTQNNNIKKHFQVNTLNTVLMDEFRTIVNEVDSNPAIEAAVLISGKPGCFIAGADITMIENCKTKEEVISLSKAGMY